MQSKLAFVSLAFAAALVAANPTPRGEGSEPASSCSTGPVQCCQSIVPASDSTAAGILGSLGIVLGDLVDVGLGCTSLLTGTCSDQAACCEDNSHGDLISISCVSIL
ncbi:hydrophobin 2 [Lentinula raphanica]|uniref:Hydrophobin n=1 Tax=Lentinula raphanica TaxID=153919 RepID=A0AA38PJP3_9AGAR|nr:hydrophobin 2 [Lentinula raphanica]KAJ3969597.1 hydrophobin 2 [Lentinula raphanica]